MKGEGEYGIRNTEILFNKAKPLMKGKGEYRIRNKEYGNFIQ